MYLISDMQASLVVVIFFVFLHKLLIRAGKSIQRKRVNKHQPSFLDKTNFITFFTTCSECTLLSVKDITDYYMALMVVKILGSLTTMTATATKTSLKK